MHVHALNQDRTRMIEMYERQARFYSGDPDPGSRRLLQRRDNQVVDRLLRASPGESALDVGCGLGVQARRLKAAGLEVWATDLIPMLVEQVAPSVDRALVADLSSLDLGRRFHRILCIGVLDFASDVPACMARLAAHLHPGGRLVVEVPRRSIGGRAFRLFYHWTRKIRLNVFSRDELCEMAAPHGLYYVASQPTFVHNLYMAFTRPPVGRES